MKGYSWILGIGLFNWIVMDVVTSYIGIKELDLAESNPVARNLIQEFGLLNSMIMSKILVSVMILMFFYVVLGKYNNNEDVLVLRYYLSTMIFIVGTYVSYTNLILIL